MAAEERTEPRDGVAHRTGCFGVGDRGIDVDGDTNSGCVELEVLVRSCDDKGRLAKPGGDSFDPFAQVSIAQTSNSVAGNGHIAADLTTVGCGVDSPAANDNNDDGEGQGSNSCPARNTEKGTHGDTWYVPTAAILCRQFEHRSVRMPRCVGSMS